MLNELRQRVNDQLSFYRRLANLVENPEFQEYFQAMPEEDQKKVYDFTSIDELREWVFKRRELDDMPYVDLRRLAARLHIPNYSRKSREFLVIAIRREHERRADGQGKSGQPAEGTSAKSA